MNLLFIHVITVLLASLYYSTGIFTKHYLETDLPAMDFVREWCVGSVLGYVLGYSIILLISPEVFFL